MSNFARTSHEDSSFYEVPSPVTNQQRQGFKDSAGRSNKGEYSKHKRFERKFKLPCLLLMAVLLIVMTILLLLIYMNASRTSSKLIDTGGNVCMELLRKGNTVSGVYKISVEIGTNGNEQNEVYCDMSTDGGGWTLVASVHKQHDGSKCDWNDRWSYNPPSQEPVMSGKGSQSWTDTSTLGSVRRATSTDYKGAAYFKGQASDVMLSHVPTDADVNEFEAKSFLKYHSANGFLTKYGSSLRNLFKDYAPLESLDIVGLDAKMLSVMQKNISPSSIFNNWYNYSFNPLTSTAYTNQSISDLGNQVFFRMNDDPYREMTYGRSYTDGKTYHITSAAGQPFATLATVSNLDGYPSKFSMKVVSRDDNGGASNIVYREIINRKGFALFYEVFRARTGNAKILPAFALFRIKYDGVTSHSSSYPNMYHKTTGNVSTYELQVKGGVKNVIIGYVLFAECFGSFPSSSEIHTYFEQTIDVFASPQITNTALKPPPKIWTPVVLVKGDIAYPNHNVTPGSLQFRAYDKFGAPYAMCPGVHVGSGEDPAKFCIGSANTKLTKPDRCGDFAAWETLRDHVFINRTNDAGFVNDLHSTILIFTR